MKMLIMTQKRSYKPDSKEFKEEAVALITEQGYTVAKAAEGLSVATNMFYSWKENTEKQKTGRSLAEDDRAELKGLPQEVMTLRVEKEILKKASVGSSHHNNTYFNSVFWCFMFQCFSWLFIYLSSHIIECLLRILRAKHVFFGKHCLINESDLLSAAIAFRQAPAIA